MLFPKGIDVHALAWTMTASSCLKNAGPLGGPAGRSGPTLPIPTSSCKGVRDIVKDLGCAHERHELLCVVLHVAAGIVHSAAALALVETCDMNSSSTFPRALQRLWTCEERSARTRACKRRRRGTLRG